MSATMIEKPGSQRRCLKCGWRWAARVSRPIACPACKRRDWAKK